MKNFNKLSTGLILGAFALALAACGDNVQTPPPPTPVSAVTVHIQEIPVTYEYAGRIAAFLDTQVRARVSGILLKRNFVEGSAVKQGDVLFEIDPADYEAVVARAQADYNEADRNATRIEKLLQQKVASAAQRDTAVAKRDSSRAALRTAKLNLDYTKVTAPISGVTSLGAVPEGTLVNASTTLLTTITQSDPIYVNFSYTDSDARSIRQLMAAMNARGEKIDAPKVRIKFGDGSEYDKLGTVDFTSPTLDNSTGTYGVRGIVENPEGRLVPGQFVRVAVEGLKLDKSIVIPEGALMQDAAGQYVFVINTLNPAEGKPGGKVAERRPVKVIRQMENRGWLIAPLETIKATPNAAAPNAAAMGDAAGKPAEGDKPQEAPETKVSYIGLKDGEEIITEGQTRLMQMMQQGLAGVFIAKLDGKDLVPAAGQAAKPAGKAEAAK